MGGRALPCAKVRQVLSHKHPSTIQVADSGQHTTLRVGCGDPPHTCLPPVRPLHGCGVCVKPLCASASLLCTCIALWSNVRFTQQQTTVCPASLLCAFNAPEQFLPLHATAEPCAVCLHCAAVRLQMFRSNFQLKQQHDGGAKHMCVPALLLCAPHSPQEAQAARQEQQQRQWRRHRQRQRL